jgi:5-methylcytosine-specific restriction enzyme subunit McrC
MNALGVPVENVYYMLCYAWRRLEGRDLLPTGATFGNQAEAMLATVLCAATERVLARGIQKDYRVELEELTTPRGKFDLTRTLSRVVSPQRGVTCQVAELHTDTPLNRLLKATLTRVSNSTTLPDPIRRRVLQLARRFPDVTLAQVNARLMAQLCLQRNVAHYRFVVELCRFLWNHAFPAERDTGSMFVDFRADERVMGLVFEEFVASFIDMEYPRARRATREMSWGATADPDHLSWLPQMRMDIPLDWPRHRTILEWERAVA